MPPPAYGTLAFPPVLERSKWRNATSDTSFPGGSITWRKALAPRPLHHTPSPTTVNDLRMATGGRFQLLQETTDLKAAAAAASAAGETSQLQPPVYPGGRPVGPPTTFTAVWGKEASMPTFNVWDYCKKHGHAPPSMPQPPINDMKSWFAEYGKPKIDCPPGFRTEFAARTNMVRKPGATDLTKTVRMVPGRVLK